MFIKCEDIGISRYQFIINFFRDPSDVRYTFCFKSFLQRIKARVGKAFTSYNSFYCVQCSVRFYDDWITCKLSNAKQFICLFLTSCGNV